MNYPFIEGISDIQETQAVTGSRTTLPFSPRSQEFMQSLHISNELLLQGLRDSQFHQNNHEEEPTFYSLKEYASKTLNSWGLKIGYLSENSQNKLTLDCIMQLIAQRFSDQDNRQQLKKSLFEANYNQNKFKSLYEQQKQQKNEKDKAIGRLENTIAELKLKMKQVEQIAKKQKEEDKKMIAMLKSKNEQIMHEMKKREQESARVKQQMKKNVGEKSALKNVAFQVYQACESFSKSDGYDKLEDLTQIYQKQRKNFMKQNLLLRQKVYDIRQQIVRFAEWIDQIIFKQSNPNYSNKMPINHNLLFRKQSIVQQLKQIIDDAKSGIKQIISMNEENMKQSQSKKQPEIITSRRMSTYQENTSPNKAPEINQNFKKTERYTMPINVPTQKKNTSIREKQVPPAAKKQTKIPQFVQNQDDASQISIISHVSIGEIMEQNKKFDKWDILFNND